ncbi:MAG: hypothetical protein CL609_07060 [Anaerolineaceae bacterium]|nr:hypothetical protein [Anaerolineaceae bacterium]
MIYLNFFPTHILILLDIINGIKKFLIIYHLLYSIINLNIHISFKNNQEVLLMNIASIFRLLATVLWIAAFGLLALSIVRAGQNRPIRRSGVLIMAAFVVALVVSLIGMGMIFVQPQERGVVVSALSPNGYREQALQPGLNWIIPGLENVVYYPVQKQNYTMSIAPQEGNIIGDDSITARTADGQQILVDASVIYHVDPNEVIKVHIDWQDRYSDELIRPVARAVIRDAVSQFGVEEVYSSQRDRLTEEITKFLILRLEENGLVLDQFLLRNITFSEEYAASVEQKQIAEQTAQQAVFVVEQRKQEAEQERQRAQGLADAAVIKAKGEAEARVIEAEAEANALNLIADALQDKPELLTYQYITKLTPSIQTMLLPSNSPFLFPLPEMQPATTSTTVAPPTTTIIPPVEEPAP